MAYLQLLAGLALLLIGGDAFVRGAVGIAQRFKVSPLLIGLTLVGFGTSLPELFASLEAARVGAPGIAVGNVVGSNIFNLLAVLGLASLVSPSGMAVAPQALRVDLPVMIVVTVACLPVVASGRRIDRWEGALLLLGYALYVTYLLAAARQHPALPTYEWVVTRVVLPILMLAFAVPVLLQRTTDGRGTAIEG